MKIKYLVIFLFIVIGGITIYFYINKTQQEKINRLEKNISFLKEERIPLRFKILDKQKDSIHFIVKFYNEDNKELNALEKTIPGNELSFDFYVIPVKDRYIAFPSKIFSDKIAAADGIKLYDLYDKNGFPAIFENKNINQDLKSGFSDIFFKIKNNQLDSLNNHFGNMVHDIKAFKSFIPETVYSIVTHTKGGIEIIEE